MVFIIIFIYRTKEDGAFDSQSASTIKLNNGTILYLREVNRYLALVCILREDSFDKQGMLLKFYNRIGGVMVSILASSEVDRGFEPR